MNRKQILSLFAVLVIGGGVVLWLHRAGAAADDSDDDSTPTVVSVQVGQITRATLEGSIAGYGIVEPAPASNGQPAASARIAPPAPGVVKQVLVYEGSQVKRGDLLVELEDRAELVAVQNARETLARQQKLFPEKNTSLKNLQQAEADLATAQARLALLQIRAPLSGVVTRLTARPGEAVDPTSVLAEVVDLDRLVISAEIPSSKASQLKPGEPVSISGSHAAGCVLDYVSPTINPTNDTVTVRAALPAGSSLRVGQSVAIRITTTTHADVLAVPEASVVTDAEGHSVISVVKDDQATQVPVTTGLRDKGLVEISGAGLKAGQSVVTVGAYGLPAKTRVSVEKP